LTALGNLCHAKKLVMPTEIVGQNGAEIHQSTKIAPQRAACLLTFRDGVVQLVLTLRCRSVTYDRVAAFAEGENGSAEHRLWFGSSVLTVDFKRS